jgi:hypothetical protein
MDLQDKVRSLDVRQDLDHIIDQISKLPIGQPLVWVWVWDVVKSTYEDFKEEDEYVVSMDLDQVWDLFWTGADKNGFTLEYGTEDLYEHIRDWMIDESIILELDEVDEDMLESDEEEST